MRIAPSRAAPLRCTLAETRQHLAQQEGRATTARAVAAAAAGAAARLHLEEEAEEWERHTELHADDWNRSGARGQA